MRWLSLFIALRFRRSKSRNSFVSFISVISTSSIALGIAALIIGLSAMNGFERELRQRILTLIPDAQISSFYEPSLQDWRSLQQQFEAQDGVTSVEPFITFSGLISRGTQLKPVQVQGVSASFMRKLEKIDPEPIDTLSFFDAQTINEEGYPLVIGDGLAQKLEVTAGDVVTLWLSQGEAQGFKNPKRQRFTILEVLSLSGELSNYLAYVPLANAQALLEMGESVSALTISVEDPFAVNHVISQMEIESDTPLRVSTWLSQDNGKYYNIYRDIEMIRTVMYLAMCVVISVACFGIVSSLVIAVKDKQREIAVLKTLGARNTLIRFIFIEYGLLSGSIGAVIGIVLGSLIATYLSAIFAGIESLFNISILNGDIYFIDFIPTELAWQDIATVFTVTLFISLIASLYPAVRACKSDPIALLHR